LNNIFKQVISLISSAATKAIRSRCSKCGIRHWNLLNGNGNIWTK